MGNICLLMIFLSSTLPLHEMAVFHLKGATVTDGKTKLKCNFAVVYTPLAVDLRKSKIVCKPKNKKPLQVTEYTIITKKPKCELTLKMLITKGKGKITHANIGMCNSLPTLKPKPTPTPTPTPMPTPKPTPMPTPTPTPTTKPMPTPTPTPTTTPMPSPMTPSHKPSIPTLPPNPPTQNCTNISNLEKLLTEMKQSNTDERKELYMKIENLENQLSEMNKIAQHLLKLLEHHIGETNCTLARTSTTASSFETEAISGTFSTTSAPSSSSSTSKTEANSGAFSTTTAASTTSTIPLVTGVIITGGCCAGKDRGWTTSEVFIPSTGKTCSFQNMPVGRYGHSLDQLEDGTLVACGGNRNPDQDGTEMTCDKIDPSNSSSTWTHFSTLTEHRDGHASFVSQGELLLLGGGYGTGKTELVRESGGIEHYNLNQERGHVCSFTDGDSVVLAGGWINDEMTTKVTRYNMQGFEEDLPDFKREKYGIGCGCFTNQDNIKVYIVAGGVSGANYQRLSTTELLYQGASSWVFGQDLPNPVVFGNMVSLETSVLFIGGGTDEVLSFDGTWIYLGNMMEKRRNVGVAVVKNITWCP